MSPPTPATSGSPIINFLNNAVRNRRPESTQETTLSPTQQQSTAEENSPCPHTDSCICGSEAFNSATKYRKPQNVLSLRTRITIVRWMIDEVARSGSEKRLSSKTISNFPQFFKNTKEANYMRAIRLWRERQKLLSDATTRGKRDDPRMQSVSTVSSVGLKRVMTKARSGRGRKRASWVIALQADLVEEFERYRKVGVKFSAKTLRALAKELIRLSTNAEYNIELCAQTTNKPIIELITPRWTQTFMHRYNLVGRSQCGELQISPEAQQKIEMRVAFFLGKVARELSSGQLKQDYIENADETHFVINMDNGKTLGFRGDQEVRYADVTSAGEGMTMMVRITGGTRSELANPFMVFKNKNCNYPIRGVNDDIPGVCYRTGPKGWIDRRVMNEWISKSGSIKPLPNNAKRVLFMDNCTGHTITEDLRASLAEINTEIRFFPANATHLIQPADSFVIQKLKAAWNARWEAHKMNLLRNVVSQHTYGTKSGLLPNPGKRFFLQLAANSVRDVNKQKDKECLTYARKAMIRCRLALNTNGIWETNQLFLHLKNIVSKYRQNFDGEDPDKDQTITVDEESQNE